MTMEPHRYDVIIVQGAHFYVPFAIESPDGTTMDLLNEGAGYSFGIMSFMDKYEADGGVELFPPLTTDNGGVVIEKFTDGNGVEWSGYWLMSASQTDDIIPFGDAVYDFFISDGLRFEKPFYGIPRLLPKAKI